MSKKSKSIIVMTALALAMAGDDLQRAFVQSADATKGNPDLRKAFGKSKLRPVKKISPKGCASKRR